MSEYKYFVDGYETMLNELKQENQKLKEALDVAVDCLDDISDSSTSSITRRSARQALSKIKALGIVKEGEK